MPSSLKAAHQILDPFGGTEHFPAFKPPDRPVQRDWRSTGQLKTYEEHHPPRTLEQIQ